LSSYFSSQEHNSEDDDNDDLSSQDSFCSGRRHSRKFGALSEDVLRGNQTEVRLAVIPVGCINDSGQAVEVGG
jgi:hypothetical protein